MSEPGKPPTYAEYQRHKATQVRPLEPTPPDIEGPFYKAGAPVRAGGDLLPARLPRKCVVRIHGRVLGTAGGPVGGAVLDVWQADEDGVYDTAGYDFRGRVEVGPDGGYSIETVVPGDYKIQDEPPDFRCAHVHVKVTAPGFKPLTTQLYFPGDPYNATDHWFSPTRVVGVLGAFDFVLAAGGG